MVCACSCSFAVSLRRRAIRSWEAQTSSRQRVLKEKRNARTTHYGAASKACGSTRYVNKKPVMNHWRLVSASAHSGKNVAMAMRYKNAICKGSGSIRKHAANKRAETERASANAKWESCRVRATKRRRGPATKWGYGSTGRNALSKRASKGNARANALLENVVLAIRHKHAMRWANGRARRLVQRLKFVAGVAARASPETCVVMKIDRNDAMNRINGKTLVRRV
jgi:hypothetical protein